MIQSTARFTAPAGSTDQLARTLSWTTITLRAARHLGVGRSIRYVLTRPKDSCLVQSNLELTHQPSPLLSCVYQRGLVTQAPCLPQKIGIYAAKLPENLTDEDPFETP